MDHTGHDSESIACMDQTTFFAGTPDSLSEGNSQQSSVTQGTSTAVKGPVKRRRTRVDGNRHGPKTNGGRTSNDNAYKQFRRQVWYIARHGPLSEKDFYTWDFIVVLIKDRRATEKKTKRATPQSKEARKGVGNGTLGLSYHLRYYFFHFFKVSAQRFAECWDLSHEEGLEEEQLPRCTATLETVPAHLVLPPPPTGKEFKKRGKKRARNASPVSQTGIAAVPSVFSSPTQSSAPQQMNSGSGVRLDTLPTFTPQQRNDFVPTFTPQQRNAEHDFVQTFTPQQRNAENGFVQTFAPQQRNAEWSGQQDFVQTFAPQQRNVDWSGQQDFVQTFAPQQTNSQWQEAIQQDFAGQDWSIPVGGQQLANPMAEVERTSPSHFCSQSQPNMLATDMEHGSGSTAFYTLPMPAPAFPKNIAIHDLPQWTPRRHYETGIVAPIPCPPVSMPQPNFYRGMEEAQALPTTVHDGRAHRKLWAPPGASYDYPTQPISAYGRHAATVSPFNRYEDLPIGPWIR